MVLDAQDTGNDVASLSPGSGISIFVEDDDN